METKQHITKQSLVNEEMKRRFKKIPETNENGNNFPKSVGHNKSHSKREVHSDAGLPWETRKISIKQTNLTAEETKKRRTNKTQS